MPVHSKPIDCGSWLAASCSMRAIASPELTPGAAAPVIVAEGERL